MKYKLPKSAPNRAIVDDVELEIGGDAKELTPDQVDRLKAVGVELDQDNSTDSTDFTSEIKETTNG